MPVEHEIYEEERLLLATRIEDVSIYTANDLGREMVVLKGDNHISLTQVFSKVITALKKAFYTDDEPMMNIAGFYNKGSWLVAIFPDKNIVRMFFTGKERADYRQSGSS